MSERKDLSETRVTAVTRRLRVDQIDIFRSELLPEVARQTEAMVLDYNFDTFSLIFELLEQAKAKDFSLSKEFVDYKVDSPILTQKYGGSNCTGLSMELKRKLSISGIETYLAPSYGRYLLTQEADDYCQIRTIDLVGLTRGEGDEWIFLAPGLTIDKPMVVKAGYKVESFGNTYLIAQVTDENFEVVTMKPNGDMLSRIFAFEEILNPDESVQKNLLRARTRYQVTRQYENGSRDFITFDFPQKKFRVSVGGNETLLDIDSFRNYVTTNSKSLEKRFRNDKLGTGFINFIDNIDSITRELLLPDVQDILAKIWKSS